jgi:hypothetical protein
MFMKKKILHRNGYKYGYSVMCKMHNDLGRNTTKYFVLKMYILFAIQQTNFVTSLNKII